MAVVGFRAGYPALVAQDAVLSPEARQALVEVSTTCLGEALATFADVDVAGLFGQELARATRPGRPR